MSDIDNIRAWMHDGTMTHSDRSDEVAALTAEVEILRHERMCVRFENSGLYAKLRDANGTLAWANMMITKQREEIEELQRLIAASAPTAGCGE